MPATQKGATDRQPVEIGVLTRIWIIILLHGVLYEQDEKERRILHTKTSRKRNPQIQNETLTLKSGKELTPNQHELEPSPSSQLGMAAAGGRADGCGSTARRRISTPVAVQGGGSKWER